MPGGGPRVPDPRHHELLGNYREGMAGVTAGFRCGLGESIERRSKSLVMVTLEKYLKTFADDKPCGDDTWVEGRMSVPSKLL
jgi:hypothetical protein